MRAALLTASFECGLDGKKISNADGGLRLPGFVTEPGEAEEDAQDYQKRIVITQAAPPGLPMRSSHNPSLVEKWFLSAEQRVYKVHGGKDGDGKRREAVVGRVHSLQASVVGKEGFAALEMTQHGSRLIGWLDDAVEDTMEDIGQEQVLWGSGLTIKLFSEGLQGGEASSTIGKHNVIGGEMGV
ncbi:hypothetical protein SLS57_010249 [Botryosphaeria dothidea]